MNNAVIQAVNRKGSVILTKICIVTTNVNLINFTNKTCEGVNILTMTQRDRNMSEWSTGYDFTIIENQLLMATNAGQ